MSEGGGAIASAKSSGQSATSTVSEPADRTQAERTTAARAFAIEVARLLSNTHCHRVVVMDVRDVCQVTDFMVLASGTSPRQMRSVAQEAVELGEKYNYKPFSGDDFPGESWFLVDFVDVVLHIFSNDARTYYDLDNLWGDAKRVEWENA